MIYGMFDRAVRQAGRPAVDRFQLTDKNARLLFIDNKLKIAPSESLHFLSWLNASFFRIIDT
jgi:hypothetical protein